MRRTLQIHIPRTGGSACVAVAEKTIDLFCLMGSKRAKARSKTSYHLAGYMCMGHGQLSSTIRAGDITRDVFDRSFRFTFVRNPWDRLTSVYEFYRGFRLRRKGSRYEEPNRFLHRFEDFVRMVCSGSHHVHPVRYVMGSPGFGQANKQVVWCRKDTHFIGRYESLQKDWKTLCDKIEMPHVSLPVINRTNKREHPDYRSYYTDKLIQLVSDWFWKEMDWFKYTFDGGVMANPIYNEGGTVR